MPKISIIVPAYNAEQHIKQCLDCILKQTVNDYEVIVIDDGSKDATASICDAFAQKETKIRVIHQINRGVSAARNVGIEQAQGEWITFIDADDTIEPHFLEAAFENTESMKADFILGRWKNDWDNHTRIENHKYEDDSLIVGYDNLCKFWSNHAHLEICRCPWGKFFRKNILVKNNIKFDEQLRYAEDTLFCLQYFTKVSSILTINKEDSNYIFFTCSKVSAIHKYKCSPESIVSARDNIMQIFYDNNLSNQRFERLMFFFFTMLEHKYLGKKDDSLRKGYYHSSMQRMLEQRCLKSIKPYDKIMYLLFKKLPHVIIYPLAIIYLKFR